ncbi:hypothetical protein N3K63_05215 [Microbacterium sp. W1N]|uniref:hypothetical protein n=1 Tax=Microbacterium festucae TaxID=2977531 RepID=UPI0021BEC9D6|nr:hypothetical protein [Microbacterium festucae]MCT9819684.1 hypothetical protein [Microbacterium festucae]
MSTNAPLPRTAVPLGITDPVEKARAELKAALFAIEEKSNIPQRVNRAADRGITRAREFHRRSPGAATAAAAGIALAVGTAVWGLVRLYTR